MGPVSTEADADTDRPAGPLWTKRNRLATVGMVLLITIAAFENLGVGTAMPTMLADLRGTSLYSWPFTANLAASVVATVLSGRLCDRYGPALALIAGPSLLLVGMLVAGTAQGMPQLLTGRVLQGFGIGLEIVAVYVLVAAIYPPRARPAAFGLLAAAWVVPSLVGPTAAGLVTQHLGWRWVFLGLAPLALAGVLMLVPTVRALPKADATAAGRTVAAPTGGDDPDHDLPRSRTGRHVLAALAAGFGLTALTWAAQHPSVGTLWLGLAGLAAIVPALRVLLPAGTLTARPGLPATVLARGLFAGAFFGVEAYLPLTLTAVHGFSPALAGLPLTVGALGWSAMSHWQGRRPRPDRARLIRGSFVVMAFSVGGMALIGPDWGLAWLALPLWFATGAAMGTAYPVIGVLALELADEGERGFASSALQVADMLFAAVTIGLGGVLLAAIASAAHPTAAVVVLALVMACLAALGAVVYRLDPDRR